MCSDELRKRNRRHDHFSEWETSCTKTRVARAARWPRQTRRGEGLSVISPTCQGHGFTAFRKPEKKSKVSATLWKGRGAVTRHDCYRNCIQEGTAEPDSWFAFGSSRLCRRTTSRTISA